MPRRVTKRTLLIGLLLLAGSCGPSSQQNPADASPPCEHDEVCPQDMICVDLRCVFGSRVDAGRRETGTADLLPPDRHLLDTLSADHLDGALPDQQRSDHNVADTAADSAPTGDTGGAPQDAGHDAWAPDTAVPREVCNGEDDDDDELIDEDFDCERSSVEPCTASCGTTGSRTCSATCTWVSCEPPAEACNGVDDDCDSQVDEGFECRPGESDSCATACGSSGSRSCTAGCSWGSCAPPGEQCNGSDDDCDGVPDNDSDCRVPVYRYACSTDHVYGLGATTPGGCIGELDGRPAWYNYRSQVSGRDLSTVPLVRLFNASVPDHLLTTVPAEMDAAVALGYTLEGNIGHCSRSAVSGSTVPLYRLAHSSTGDHFYTTATAERDLAVSSAGYIYESIACHVWQGP